MVGVRAGPLETKGWVGHSETECVWVFFVFFFFFWGVGRGKMGVCGLEKEGGAKVGGLVVSPVCTLPG